MTSASNISASAAIPTAMTGAFLPVAEPDLSTLEEELVVDAVRSGWVSSIGRYVTEFEETFAEFCGMSRGVATSNGTTALHLALVAAGIGAGDEVIVPSLTFIATAAAVRHAGAEPVLVDCEPEIGTLDPATLEQAIGPKTKAIIVVHLFGHPADMDPIMEIARRRGILVIEDAAEAHGALYKGRVVGSLADISCFSFYGNKVMTTGEGGMVLTNDATLTKRLQFLRDHAMDPGRRYWHPEVGFNYRLTNLQAALGVAQLRRYPEIRARRQAVLDRYQERMQASGLGILVNPSREWATPIPWLVTAILPEHLAGRRDELMAALRRVEIDSRPYFVPAHLQPPYAGCRTVARGGVNGLPQSESLAARGLNLPSSGKLTTADIDRVVSALMDALR
jgi:perosamine synthetase